MRTTTELNRPRLSIVGGRDAVVPAFDAAPATLAAVRGKQLSKRPRAGMNSSTVCRCAATR
jgi:hypothetical protein